MERRLLIVYFTIVVTGAIEKKDNGKGIAVEVKREYLCKDMMPESACQLWVRHHACITLPQRMFRYCEKSCNFCGGVCLDSPKADCRWFMSHGACTSHPERMKKICPRTCGFCGKALWQPAWRTKLIGCVQSKYGCCWDKKTSAKGPNDEGCPVCVDKKYYICSQFKRECHPQSRNKMFMERYCARTCGSCRRTRSIT